MDKRAAEEACRLMSVEELLRATTTDRKNYEPAFLHIAQAELSRRWHQVQEVKKTVLVRFNEQDGRTVTLEQALALLAEEIRAWDAWVFTNCLEDVLLLQKERTGWLGHHVRDGEYVASFHMGDLEEARRTVQLFLELENVADLFDDLFDVTQMIVLKQTNSRDLVNVTAEEFEEREIPVLVQTTTGSRLFEGEGESVRGPRYVVLVSPEHALEAQEVLDSIDARIERFHEEAEQCSDRGEIEREVEIYNRILQLAPNDEIALFNKGIVLLETEQYSEAADCLIEAALVADDETVPRVEECLKELAAKIPGNTEVLSALADLARRQGDLDRAKAYFASILSVQPDDPLAHVSLGHLYLEESENDEQALLHFREYIRLNPDADDHGMIEDIVRVLEEKQEPRSSRRP